MTFPFADIISSNSAAPATSGPSLSSARKSGGFAEALAAVQPGIEETLPSGEVVAPGGILPPRALDGLAVDIPPAELTGLDPAVVAEDIMPTVDAEDLLASVDGTEIPADPALAQAPSAVPAAAPVVTPAPLALPAEDGEAAGETDLLLRAAAPTPVLPEVPGEDAPLIEGRASASGAAPGLPSGSADVPEAPVLTRQQIEAVAPRALADEPVMPVENARPASAPAEPIPEAARQAATTPHVTSLQAKVTATPTAEGGNAETPEVAAETPDAVPPVATAESVEQVLAAKPMPIVAPEDNLEADVKTRAKAADGALDVLTKEKAEAKPVPAPPVREPEAPVDDTRAPHTVATDETTVKTADAKPQAEPEKTKPVAAEKVLVQEERPAPQPLAMTDKPVAHEAAKPHQALQALPAAVLPHIASEMASRVKQGATQFEIRLDPPELGRVDVRIEIDSEGRVVSRLTVEKTETLDLLKADQRALERALQDAGFKADQNSLSFSLRDERGNGQAKFEDQRLMHDRSGPNETEEEPARLAAEIAYRAAMRGPGGLDLTV